MNKKILTAFIAPVVFSLGVMAGAKWPEQRASVPWLIPYHGLLEKNGELIDAVGENTVNFRVALFDAAQAGNKVWPAGEDVFEEHTVNVFSGRFSLQIGSNIAYQHIPDTPLYLEVQVKMDEDSWVPLNGRQQFLSSPFAIAAERSDSDFLVANDLNVTGHAGVGGNLQVTGTADQIGADLHGPAQDGTGLGAVRISDPSQHMLLDGDDIDSASDDGLGLNRTSGKKVVTGGDLEVTGMVQLKVDETIYSSGGNSDADSYELTSGDVPECIRGRMFVGRPSADSTQDSLCVCLNMAGDLEWWCFSP